MHDLAHFRNHFDTIAERLATRGNPPQLDQFRELDRQRRSAISQAEQLKARRNAETAEIGKLRKDGRRHLRAPAADARHRRRDFGAR